MKYFTKPQTLEELKKQYKKLAFENHPDRGGNAETMKKINVEYDELFQKLKNVHKNANGETYKTETAEPPEMFKNIIEKIIIFGAWIWLTGNTFPHREQLKELKFRFSNSKKAWYFHNDGYVRKTKKRYTLDEIRDLYGVEKIKNKPQLKVEIV